MKQNKDLNSIVTYIKAWNIVITITSILLILGGIIIILIANHELYPRFLIFMGKLIILLGIIINVIRIKNKQ